jgi:hypothetical protein
LERAPRKVFFDFLPKERTFGDCRKAPGTVQEGHREDGETEERERDAASRSARAFTTENQQ